MMKPTRLFILVLIFLTTTVHSQTKAPIWQKFEQKFSSQKNYGNPIYELKEFYALLTSPSGRVQKINGFWDGGQNFKIRFSPDELGRWTFETVCSDQENPGLHGVKGQFDCIPNNSELEIYRRGSLAQPKGTYHLTYNDGAPFLWIGCTAWNGALKSTEEEWDTYLKHRVDHHYSVIQLATTQWRGCENNSRGLTAFKYEKELTVDPLFFQDLDKKIDKVNEYGLIAAPVLLWALPVGEGRHLSPGYILPLEEAVMLARYIVARYGGNQVVWMLGGDGRYAREYEQRWLEIGRRVFADHPPGLVAQHPHGRLWIGDNHAQEEWLDIVGYQSSHSNAQGTVDWINKGPIANRWRHLPARPVMNLEPNYEEIRNQITDEDVRNASYWSLFATPISGITYGANGIWPWIREGEKILNHRQPKSVSTWQKSIDFPGSLQIGYLAEFLKKLEWQNFRPANELLAEQPGDKTYNHFISLVRSLDQRTILVYIPKATSVQIYNSQNIKYRGEWFNPRTNAYAKADIKQEAGVIKAQPPGEGDFVLTLIKE